MANSIVDTFNQYKRSFSKKVADCFEDTTSPFSKLKGLHEAPSMQDLSSFLNKYPLSSILPYEAYDESSQIYFNRDSVGFVLDAMPATCLSLQDLKILNGIFSQNHRPNTCIQVSMISDTNFGPTLEAWKDLKGNSTQNADFFNFMAQNRVRHLKKGRWNSLFDDQPFIVKDFKLVISYTLPLDDNENSLKEDVEFLKRMRSSTIGLLKSAKIPAKNMEVEDFINLLWGVLNPLDGDHARVQYDKNNLINKQMVDSDSHLLVGSSGCDLIHKKTPYSIIPFHARQFPKEWGGYLNNDLIGSFSNNVLRIGCPFIATMTVQIPDQMSAKTKIAKNQIRATQMSDTPMAKFATQWIDRKKDWDFTAKRIENGDKYLKAFYQIILISPQGKEDQSIQSLQSLYDSLGWSLSRGRFTSLHCLLGALPMGLEKDGHKVLHLMGHYRSRLSWTCVNIAPWIGEWKGTQTPLLQLIGRRGQLISFNHFDNKKGNYNIACAATSGAGKSFLTQELIFSILGIGGRVFTIDAGGSYKDLCQSIGGTYIDFGVGRPNLNPFSKIFSKKSYALIEELSKNDPEYSNDDYINDFMPMLVKLISQMASPSVPLDELKLTVLEKAIFSAIKKYQDKTTITKIQEECLKQKGENNKELREAIDLANMLHSYTKDGMYGRYFEGENNIDLDNNFVVLELDALNSKGSLQSVVLLILMVQINQVMYLSGNKSQKKQVIIDEAWRLLGSGNAGDFIEEGYRVARKHGGSYLTITQNINDYYKSETAEAALSNSDFNINLRQKPDQLKKAESEGRISNDSGEVDILSSLETIHGLYSELAITSPDGIAVARFCVDPIAEKIYSTSPDESQFLHDEQANGKSLLEAVYLLLEKQNKLTGAIQ